MDEINQLQQNIILGTDGNKPGLTIYDIGSGTLKRILSLPAEQGVYAIGISADGRIIAAGTGNGEIYRLTHQPDTGSCCYHTERLTSRVAAPILSVCFVDNRRVAASDTAGRCLLWQPGKTQPKLLPTEKMVVWSLFRPDDNCLAGLCTGGRLLIWDCAEGDIIKTVEVPGLPKEFSVLIKPVYWHTAGRWVWPGSGGLIVFYDRLRNEVRSISAHSSDVYAVVVCGDQLLTIGIDGAVQRWCVGTDEPVGNCKAPVGIIEAAVWANGQPQLMLINDEGRAGVYSWADNRLNFVQNLSGENFRTAHGPDMQKIESAMQHQKAMHVREICTRIREAIARREQGDLDGLHQQLVQSGYEHVSLALRAEEYRINNDIVPELQCYMKLTKLVPKEDGRSKNSLLRYVGLLETVWQPKKACSIYEQLARMHPDSNDYAEAMCRASRYAGIIEEGNYVIGPDIPLVSLVKSAILLNEPFTGRYVVKTIREPINCNVIISADGFIKKHKQLCKESKTLRAERTDLWWISKNRIEQVTTIILGSDGSELFSRLELTIKFLDTLQTVLVPMVVFNAGPKTNEMLSLGQHNQEVLKELQRILADAHLLNGWLKIVYGRAMDIIRQMITKAMADRNQ
jgi:hypothetical protein